MTRPFDKQSPLEKLLRVFLYSPVSKLDRLSALLPKHVKKKEYRQAANCLDGIRQAEREVDMFNQLLELYEAERIDPTPPLLRITHKPYSSAQDYEI